MFTMPMESPPLCMDTGTYSVPLSQHACCWLSLQCPRNPQDILGDALLGTASVFPRCVTWVDLSEERNVWAVMPTIVLFIEPAHCCWLINASYLSWSYFHWQMPWKFQSCLWVRNTLIAYSAPAFLFNVLLSWEKILSTKSKVKFKQYFSHRISNRTFNYDLF